MQDNQTGSALSSSLLTLVAITVLLGIAVMMLPKGYDDDLSKVGQGVNTVVLIQNKGAQQSMDLLNLLNQVRDDYQGRVDFLIADVDTEEGLAFKNNQRLDSSELVLFGPDGTQLNVLNNSIDEAGLRKALDNAFRLPP